MVSDFPGWLAEGMGLSFA